MIDVRHQLRDSQKRCCCDYSSILKFKLIEFILFYVKIYPLFIRHFPNVVEKLINSTYLGND